MRYFIVCNENGKLQRYLSGKNEGIKRSVLKGTKCKQSADRNVEMAGCEVLPSSKLSYVILWLQMVFRVCMATFEQVIHPDQLHPRGMGYEVLLQILFIVPRFLRNSMRFPLVRERSVKKKSLIPVMYE